MPGSPSYYDVWKCMREMEVSLRYASEVYGHLLSKLPRLGGEALPVTDRERAAVAAVVRGFVVADPHEMDHPRCETPPNCMPPRWNTYTEWMGGVAGRVAALAQVLALIGSDPAALAAIRAFEETRGYRSEPWDREVGSQA